MASKLLLISEANRSRRLRNRGGLQCTDSDHGCQGDQNPHQAYYAVVRRELVSPRKSSFGPITREDKGVAEYYLYKGESFRVGQNNWKVNWISMNGEIGIAMNRTADVPIPYFKFEMDNGVGGPIQ